LLNFVLPAYREAFGKLHQDVLRGENGRLELEITGLKGTRRWLEIHAVPLRDRDTTIATMLAITRDISERKRAEQEILKLNAELEQRVAGRTRQLEAANKELEAFSYSVSHDLRAPLRGIDGFSQMLLKKYAGQLDATGSDYLQRIRHASLRMGELIDDLLQLSRVGRSQVKPETVNLGRLARSIVAAFQEREPERKVVTEVQDDIEVSADPHLLKIMLENLLGNAWKFTAKQEQAIIRIGTSVQDGELVVFFKDNGVGFDMKYAHKLFGAFQRLHGATEFEGSGIGLATAQRIVNLHGGRIWADAAVGKGATFYFSLPRSIPDAKTTAQPGGPARS
jgi:light-regulated signal transduction histidine kinase (bacteriophytochrome)